MTLAFQDRVEAAYEVPSSTTVSVSSGALTSAVNVTWPAATYFHTEAGGVSSGITALQTAINAAVGGAPNSAAAIGACIGYGTTWSAGWLCQETSGNLAAAFGSPTLTAGSSPTYSNTGPGNGGDLAVGFDSTSDTFAGGDVYDLGATDDLVLAFVVKFDSVSGTSDILGKGYAPGWFVERASSSLAIYTHDGVDSVSASVGLSANVWYACIAVVDRTNNQSRIGLCNIGGAPSVSSIANIAAVGAINNATPFALGACGVDNIVGGHKIAAAYIGVGTGYAGTLVANLSAACQDFADAIASAFTVSMSTSTGLVTVSNSFWPCAVAWTSTDARDLLGYVYEFDYPQSAAHALTLGIGTFTAGYLCNETSGSLASAFGTPATLTAASIPTYSNQAARGGADKAVSFPSATDGFDGGDSLDVGASEDFIFAWCGKWDAVTNDRDVFGKVAGALDGWRITHQTTSMRFLVGDGTDTAVSDPAGVPTTGEWYVAIAALDRAANTVRFGFQMLRTGTQTLGSSAAAGAVGAISNSATFKVGGDAAVNNRGTGHYVSAFYVGIGSGYAAGIPAGLSAALSTFAGLFTSQTGTQQAKGVWFPDAPLNCDDHPSMTPPETDLRAQESPTGNTFGLSGNEKYVHTNVGWERSPVDRIREASAAYENASLEVFFRDAISGVGGHDWMGPCSALQVYWNNAGNLELLGSDANDGEGVAGWKPVGVYKFTDIAKPSQRGWVGQFNVTLPRLVSEG